MEIIVFTISFLLCSSLYIIKLQSKKDMILLKDKSVPLEEVIPIHSIEDDFVINGNGDLTAGYKIFLPEVFTLSDSAIESMHRSLDALLKMLPSGTIVHQQTFIYTEPYTSEETSNNFLFQDNLKNLKGKEIIQSYVNIYLTFANGEQKKKNPKNASLLRKSNFPLKEPFEIEDRLKEIFSVILNFENGLRGVSEFELLRMTSEELNNAIFDYINLSYSSPTLDAKKEVVNPLSVTDAGDLKVGNQLVSIVSLVEEGASVYEYNTSKSINAESLDSKVDLPRGILSKCGMMFSLTLGLPYNHIVNSVIEILDNEDTVASLQSEKTSLNFLTNFHQPAKEKQKEIDVFCNMINEHNYQTCYTSVNVIINDTEKEILDKKTSLAKQAFSNMNQSTVYIENEESANLFFSSIPGNARANYRGFVNTTVQALCYLNKENLYVSSKTGHIFTDRFGTPVKIDLWNYPGMDNRNRIIIGPSGAGKSFLTNNIVLQSIVHKKDTVMIDIGGSYKNMVSINGGKYFDSRIKSEFQFNPFLCPQDINGNYKYLDTSDEEGKEDLIKTIAAVLSFIWKEHGKVTPVQKAILENSIKGFYDHVNANLIFPNLINYKKYLPIFHETLNDYEKGMFDIRELEILLKVYTEGDLSYLLNAETNIDITNDTLIAYDMEDVKGKDHFPIVAILTLQIVIDKIKRRPGIAKTLIIDEALDFLNDEKFGEFIAYLFRTFRKKEGEIIIAAQNVNFIKNASQLVRDSITINCDTKIILEHGKKYWDNLKDLSLLSISDDEIDKIKSLQRSDSWRDFFLKVGNDSFIFRNSVSQMCSVAFDSRQSTMVEISKLFIEKRSMPAAISQYIENVRKKNQYSAA